MQPIVFRENNPIWPPPVPQKSFHPPNTGPKVIMHTLKELFLVELADIYDAEQRMARVLPKMIKAATCARLRGTFQFHLKESARHLSRLERVSRLFGEKLKEKRCKSTVGLLEEANELAAKFKGS